MPDVGDLNEKIEKKLEKSKLGRWLKTIGAMIIFPLIGFVGEQIWKVYTDFKDLQDQVHDLKLNAANNQAIWNSIAENRNRNSEMKVEVEVIKRLFDREFARGGGLKSTPGSSGTSGYQKEALPGDHKVIDPPKLIPPVEPDKLRHEEEEKFPVQQQRQYKK